MRKIFFTIMLSTLILPVIADVNEEIYTKLFISRFNVCMPFKMEQSLKNNTVQYNRHIAGWKAHKCRYNETEIINNTSKEYSCQFSRDEVTALTQAMRSDSMGQGVAKIEWDKMKQDKNVCQSPLK